MASQAEERINDREVKNLREAHDAEATAVDALVDAKLKRERLQRRLAVQYKLRGKDEIDSFGFIIREKRV
jgi:hypothetical protein